MVIHEKLPFHHSWQEYLWTFVAATLVVTCGPFIGMNVGTTVLWEAIDRGFKGGLVESNNELTGLLMGRFIPWFERVTKPFNSKLVKNPEDAFLVNLAVFMCLGLPLLLSTFGRLHLQYGSSTMQALLLCYIYHVIRLGPMFMNFAYVYAVCHKEGHAAAARNGLFRPPLDRRGPFRFIFNWWVGLYFGVLPSTFAIGHSINHHKYNNGPADVITTSDRPRDDWRCFIAYIPRFGLYASNVSTTWQFCQEGMYKTAFNTILGSLYYLVFVGLVARAVSPWFSFAYIVYPFLEQTVLLSGVNWVWHAFLDPDDVENEYVASITILGGTINVLNEDSHVVHHQYPGMHWTTHPRLLTKHHSQYEKARGSVFYGTHTFEMLALILMADYDKMADRFVGRMPENAEAELFHDGFHDKDKFARPQCLIPHAEAAELIKTRLRFCWWGPRVTHKNDALLRQDAGTKLARLKEWEAAGAAGWGGDAPAGAELAEAPAAPAPQEGKKQR